MGAVKPLDSGHGEIKSMRTAANFIRQGISRKLLRIYCRLTQERDYYMLSLETATAAAFKPEQSLYQEFCFEECKHSIEHPYSIFITKMI